MKFKALRIISFFAISLLAFACSSDGELIDDDNPSTDTGGSSNKVETITVSEQSITSPIMGNTQIITVEASCDWTATTTADEWIIISPSEGGAGQTEVEITTLPNSEKEERTAKITFSTGKKSAQVNLLQEWSYYFMVPCSKYNIDFIGGEIYIDGLPETGFTINLTDEAKEWIEVDGKTLIVNYNDNSNPRKTVIEIKDNTINKTYNVTLSQDGGGDNPDVLRLSELIIDGYVCPTDKLTNENDFMYSVDMDATPLTKTFTVKFQGTAVQWITIGTGNKKYYSGDQITFNSIEAGTHIKIYAHNKAVEQKGESKLIFSGLPIVEVTTRTSIKDEPKVDCVFKLFDPKARTDDGDNKNLMYFESKAGIEYRGAGAQRYIKKPYNFKLYTDTPNADGSNKREAELLNIRNDNSWILDAMFLDVAHMRNRVCFDIWNQFNKPYYVSEKPKAMSGTRGHHVEMFLNGEYRGLFILSDRVDRKQYQIEQNGGYIYKATGWSDACCLRDCSTPSNNGYMWGDIEQEYPDADDGQKPNFNYMAELIQFVGKSSKEEFNAKFEEHLDMYSIVDAFIYLNMIVAHDNIGRNTFWILRNVNESKKFMQGLWDLDGTLGRTWNRFEENPNQGWVSGSFRIYQRIIDENPANIHQKIYDRWNELKDGPLAPANFNQIVDGYVKIMVESGARDREVARWKALDQKDRPSWGYADVYFNNIEQEAVYMKNWWAKRHEKLNSLINSLKHK